MLGWRNSTGSQALTWPDPWVQLTVPWTSQGSFSSPEPGIALVSQEHQLWPQNPTPSKKKKKRGDIGIQSLGRLSCMWLVCSVSWTNQLIPWTLPVLTPAPQRGHHVLKTKYCACLYNYRELDTVCIHIKGKYGLRLSGRCQRRLWNWPPARQSIK